MKINEYKKEVNSLTLSKDFKQELKEKLLEAANDSPAPNLEKKKSAAIFGAKYSRYIALAACLLLVVSAISVVSISGLISVNKGESANDGEQSISGEKDPDASSDRDANASDHDNSAADGDNTDSLYTDPIDSIPNNAVTVGPDIATPPEGVEYRSTIKTNYPTRTLTVTNEDGVVKVNGIGVGDGMEAVRRALYLTDYYFTPDAVITLVASEEEGKWQVVVRFSNNIVAEIEVKE